MKQKKLNKLLDKAWNDAQIEYSGSELKDSTPQEIINSLWVRHIQSNNYLSRYKSLNNFEKKALITDLLFESTYVIELQLKNKWDLRKINDLLQIYNEFLQRSLSEGNEDKVFAVSLDKEVRLNIINSK